MTPFLTVITRHVPRRGEFLKENIRSLRDQSDPDYQHLIIEDPLEQGVEWANGMMSKRSWDDVRGDYVLVLDDDDVMSGSDVISRLKKTVELGADLIIVRMDHGALGILPPDELWGRVLARGRVGCSSVVPSADVFLQAVKYYDAKYDSDFDFIKACERFSKQPVWLDIVATRRLQIGAFSTI